MQKLSIGGTNASYLLDGGILSANVFQRRISNYMRSQVALETVPWANQPRYVSRPQNIGNWEFLCLELILINSMKAPSLAAEKHFGKVG